MSVTPHSTQSKAARKHNGKIRKKTKKELRTENYRRQMETLFDKIHRMVSSFGVDIFLHVRRNSKQKLYTSSEDLSWPAGIKDIIANSYPMPAIITPSSFEAHIAKKKRKTRHVENNKLLE